MEVIVDDDESGAVIMMEGVAPEGHKTKFSSQIGKLGVLGRCIGMYNKLDTHKIRQNLRGKSKTSTRR